MARRLAAGGAGAVLLAVVVPRVPAQQSGPTLTFGGGIALAEHRVDAGSGVEISAGTLFDGAVRLGVGRRAEIAVVGRTGVLHPGNGATLPREVAEIGLDGAYRMREWLDLVAGLRVRSYTTSVARQRWTAPHLGAAARLPFALPGLRGLLGAAVHPFATVSGLGHPEVTLGTGAGLEYARGRFDVQLLYALERYEFARGTVDQRLEQLSVVTLRLSVTAVGAAPRGTPNPAVTPE